MVALKFTPIIADTLRGVYLYFNKTLSNSTTSLRFYLKVWSNNNGVPGSEIYSQVGEKPIYTDSLNKFAYIKLDTPIKLMKHSMLAGSKYQQICSTLASIEI